ncbi:MAG: PglZ domain-containing protein [Firmicutes bacterium]|nr:PglZ domain-containing protein [Bacillota bacterium]
MTLVVMLRQLLEEELRRQGPAGLVVLYDSGATLSPIIARAVPEGARLLRFTGSYLALRFALEFQDPELKGRSVVYVPEQPPKESWLRDWELLGARWDMDLLELLRRAGNLLPTPRLVDLLRRPENARDLAQAWESLIGDQPLSETVLLDALLALSLGLPRWQVEEGILLFASGTVGRKDLVVRGLWPVFAERLREWAGWGEAPEDEAELRRRLEAALLLSELVEILPELSGRFAGVLPSAPKRALAAGLARAWRDRENLRSAYLEAAHRVQGEYELATVLNAHEALLRLDTFPIVDDVWRQEVLNAVAPDGSNLNEKAPRLVEIAGQRTASFWAKQGRAAYWRPVALAARLAQGCQQASEEAGQVPRVGEFVLRYTADDGWWWLDLWALQLAAQARVLSPEERRRLAHPAWRAYGAFLDYVNRLFAEAVRRESWVPEQREFWEQWVSGKMQTAVFLADALRYDLARYLKDLLAREGYEITLGALPGVLPSVTEVGMPALLPEAQASLEVAAQASGLTVRLKGVEVNYLNGRQEWLQGRLGPQAKVVKLAELEQAKTRGVSLLVVLSREIDKLGTFAADLDPVGLLNMVDQIARGIHYLREQGFCRFVVAADHGFLFLPPGVEPERINAPPAAACKERFAVGASHEGCVVMTAAELGLVGREIFAFLPGLAVFALPGGTRPFLHGGLSLQECIVPVLEAAATPLGQKVSVTVELPDCLTSRIASVRVVVREAVLFARPRRVVVDINGKRSEPKELHTGHLQETITVSWLGFDESPPTRATIRLFDGDSGQVLEEASVPVNLVL